MLQVKPSIAQMKSYSSPFEGRMNYLRLDFNENTRGTSPKVLEALRQITTDECACYPEYEDFNLALSQFVGVAPQQVIATNGSDEAIRALFDTYIEKGDEVILLSPSYSLYEHFAQIAGAQIKWVLFGRDFSFPIDEVLRAITPNTKLIALANPNNPTGTVIDRNDLQKIIEANARMVVLIDEAYGQFAKICNIDFTGRYPNVFVTQTFSKAYGLAGLRMGYLVSSPSNIEAISKVISPAYSVDRLAMLAATAVMKDRDYFDQHIAEIIDTREEFTDSMQALGSPTIRSEANFVLVFFGERAPFVLDELEKKNILVRSRSEESLRGYLRITIGTKEQMQRVTKEIANVINN